MSVKGLPVTLIVNINSYLAYAPQVCEGKAVCGNRGSSLVVSKYFDHPSVHTPTKTGVNLGEHTKQGEFIKLSSATFESR